MTQKAIDVWERLENEPSLCGKELNNRNFSPFGLLCMYSKSHFFGPVILLVYFGGGIKKYIIFSLCMPD